jgi:hypothetical protein
MIRIIGLMFIFLAFAFITGNAAPDTVLKWTEKNGAVFMYNNDSDLNNGKTDCSDKIIDGPDDLQDLTPVWIGKISELKDGSKLYISVSENARPYVHLFYKDGADYVFIENNEKQELPVKLLLNNDLELRIEACSYAGPQWDGKCAVTAILEAPEKTYTDTVRLKVAPFIMLSAVQRAQRIYVRDYPGKNEKFIRALKDITTQLGVQLKIVPAGNYPAWEIWLQDIMEIGYSRTPGVCNHVVLKSNRGMPLDDMPEKEMLAPGFGWFRIGEYRPGTGGGGGGDGWLDWFGNLEVTPPLPGNPYGRVFYGYNKTTGNSMNPQVVQMLEAQGVQTPLIKIHTGWLLIKHVDEIFNFVPSKGKEGKGFKVLVPDVTLTYELLDKWNKEGKGSLPVLKDLKEKATISTLLENRELKDYNIKLQKEEIEKNIDSMKQAIGIDETDIIRIPALFEKYREYAAALMPNMVNSVHMNGHMLIAEPRGPVENGNDLIQEYVRAKLSKEGIEAHFVDDLPYHLWGGEVHCGTNVAYKPGDAIL